MSLDDTKNKDIVEVEDNDDEDEYEDICYICRRPESVAGKMIHIPTDICICNDCMQKTIDTMQNSGFNYDDLLGMNNMANMMINNSPKTERVETEVVDDKEDEDDGAKIKSSLTLA